MYFYAFQEKIMLAKNLTIPGQEIAEFCKKHNISKFSLFGSVLDERFHPASDVDILVEFIPGKEPGFAFFSMQDELSSLLGRPVELHTPNFLSSHFRNDVMETAEVIYAAS
jgi:predicted nucleotidyltransferase